jgi:hypothetical protein
MSSVPPTPTTKRGPGRPPKTDSERTRKPNRKSLGTVRHGRSSPEARKLAATILEVLGGVRTTGGAAEALGCSVPRYYHLEARALEGFVAACEPLHPGRQPDPARDAKSLEKKCARLERELGRQQALVRAAHRMVGLQPQPAAKKVGKKRPRRPTARALVVAEALKAPLPEAPKAPPTADSPSSSA